MENEVISYPSRIAEPCHSYSLDKHDTIYDPTMI